MYAVFVIYLMISRSSHTSRLPSISRLVHLVLVHLVLASRPSRVSSISRLVHIVLVSRPSRSRLSSISRLVSRYASSRLTPSFFFFFFFGLLLVARVGINFHHYINSMRVLLSSHVLQTYLQSSFCHVQFIIIIFFLDLFGVFFEFFWGPLRVPLGSSLSSILAGGHWVTLNGVHGGYTGGRWNRALSTTHHFLSQFYTFL